MTAPRSHVDAGKLFGIGGDGTTWIEPSLFDAQVLDCGCRIANGDVAVSECALHKAEREAHDADAARERVDTLRTRLRVLADEQPPADETAQSEEHVGQHLAAECTPCAIAIERQLAGEISDHPTYRTRRLDRADRLRGWADGREAKSAAALAQAEQISSMIPFGQPILVGHHSERRHRRDLDRIHRNMDAGVEHSRKARSMRSRADGIEAAADGAIYGDDPDAIERLTERIADLEAERDRIKAYNASCRKGAPDESLLDEHQRASLESVRCHSPYSLGKGGAFPAYGLTNLSGNIRRNRERLDQLKRQLVRRVASGESENGVSIDERAHGYVAVTFAEKPDADVRAALKSAGFRWQQGSWWGKREQLPANLGSPVSVSHEHVPDVVMAPAFGLPGPQSSTCAVCGVAIERAGRDSEWGAS